MPAMFERAETNVGGVFSADKAKLLFVGAPGVTGALVQGLNFTYAQNISRLYEVGGGALGTQTNVYYVGGRTQGNMTLQRVIGPSPTVSGMYKKFGNVCNAKQNTLELNLQESDCTPGVSSGKPLVYTLKGCVITQVGVSVNATDMIINEQLQMMFSDLKYDPAA